MSYELIGQEIDFRHVIWMKEVGDENRWAYMDASEGGTFELHWPKVPKVHPQKPAIGDIILLKQHRRLTHLVIPYSNQVLEKNTNPRWPYSREVICLRRYGQEQAPWLKDVFPFSTKGGAHGIGYQLQSFINKKPGVISLEELQKKIWLAFFSDINAKPVKLFDAPDEPIETFPEGRIIEALHKKRERSAKLVKMKKDQALAKNDKLICEVCEFSFTEKYGDIGEGFIEAHHKTPVHELLPESTTTINDLALVCSNCHRMLHRARPWKTIEELKVIIG